MNLSIKTVVSKEDLGNFIRLPWQVYKGDKNWVAPLLGEEMKFYDPQKNPFFDHSDVVLFLAMSGHYLKGRIAAIIDRNYMDFHNEKTGFFGCFESVNDKEVSEMLFSAASDWLREHGMSMMRGPMNFSTNNTCGLLVNGFDQPPVVMMTYNPGYYIDLYENYGLRKAKDLYAYLYVETEGKIPDLLERNAPRLEKRGGFHVRKIDMKNFDEEVKLIKKIYNAAWEDNWGFVPMTDSEFDHLANDLKMIVDPDLVFVAEVNGEPVGFSLAIPDINYALNRINGRLLPFGIFKLLYHKRRIHKLRVITMGVIKGFRNRGIDLIFYYYTFKEGFARGYDRAEMSWVLEDNFMMNKALEKIGAEIYKTYRIYDYPLE
ncbi:N-acetyltransferase [bacterium]|nr:N-acetyltransferase [bacterium]